MSILDPRMFRRDRRPLPDIRTYRNITTDGKLVVYRDHSCRLWAGWSHYVFQDVSRDQAADALRRARKLEHKIRRV